MSAEDRPVEGTHKTMADALASIGLHNICDKHGPGQDRCKGCGYVCSAHPHTPPWPLYEQGCQCGAPVITCRAARTSPIRLRIAHPHMLNWYWEVIAKVADEQH